jgi:hypothetical protein
VRPQAISDIGVAMVDQMYFANVDDDWHLLFEASRLDVIPDRN